MNEFDATADRTGAVVPLPRGAQRRMRPATQWPIAVVLVILGVGLLLVALGAFRAGTVTMACSAWVAFLLRLVLSDKQAGLLVVRRRSVDTWILGLLGLLALILAFWVPIPK